MEVGHMARELGYEGGGSRPVSLPVALLSYAAVCYVLITCGHFLPMPCQLF